MKRVQELFDQYGGIPRFCIRFLCKPDQLAEHQDNFENAIQNIPKQTLHDHILNAAQLSFDDVTPTIFMVKRMDLDKVSGMVVEPATSSVQIRLKSQIRVLQHADQVELYNSLASASGQWSRPIAGLVFETLAQLVLEHRIVLELLPMQKQFLGPQKKICWMSTYKYQSSLHTMKTPNADLVWENEESALADVALSGLEEAHSSVTIDFQPSSTVEYEGNSIKKINADVLYVPKSPNQVAFDSFIVFKGSLYIFQFTITSKHDIKPGLVDFFFSEHQSLPPKAKWHLIFVVPPGNTITCPQPSESNLVELLKEERVFSAQLNIKERDHFWDDSDSEGDDREVEVEDMERKVCYLSCLSHRRYQGG